VTVKAVKEVRGAPTLKQGRLYGSRVEVKIQQSGEKIEVEARYPKGPPSMSDQVRVLVHLEIIAPANSDLSAKTIAGSLDVSGLDGRLELATADGDLNASNCSGQIKAYCADGSLTLTSARGDVEARTVGGALKIEGILSALEAESAKGRIDIRVLPGSTMKQDWSVHATAGNVKLYLPDDFAADLTVNSSDGEIYIEESVNIRGSLSKRGWEGKLNGGGRLLRIHSSDGDVRILR
jgi:DUF4097 and DUF4098 domain-containing protein YvlB